MSYRRIKRPGLVDGLDTRHHPLYNTWIGIKKRCCIPTNKNYRNYGGRGIKMCERWLNSFAAFAGDMGPKPTPSHSVDRVDNNGPYSPENCRWATPKQQGRNARYNTRLTAGGKTQTMADWEDETKIPTSTMINRLNLGWTHAQTVGVDKPPRRVLEDVLPKGWTTMAKKAGLHHQTVMSRVIDHGWTLERALSTPLQAKPFISVEGKGRWTG